jgi:hypothetical protein
MYTYNAMVNKRFGIKEAKVLQENYCCLHMVIVLVRKHYMSICYLLQLLISTASFKMVCVCVCKIYTITQPQYILL